VTYIFEVEASIYKKRAKIARFLFNHLLPITKLILIPPKCGVFALSELAVHIYFLPKIKASPSFTPTIIRLVLPELIVCKLLILPFRFNPDLDCGAY
jgi:hypothetical protein